MSGTQRRVIHQDGVSFLKNYKRLHLVGRRLGLTAEGVAIEGLNRLNLKDGYTVQVKIGGQMKLFRLEDYRVSMMTYLMIENAKNSVKPEDQGITISVIYGEWRNSDLFSKALRVWEEDVVEMTYNNLRHAFQSRYDVVFAAVRMFGEIWATRGVIV